jgi:hypothetical protein
MLDPIQYEFRFFQNTLADPELGAGAETSRFRLQPKVSAPCGSGSTTLPLSSAWSIHAGSSRYGINRLITSLVEMLLRRVECMVLVYLPIFLSALFDWSIHRQDGEVKNADGKKSRRSKSRMGKKIEGKKRRITKNVEW